MASPSDNDPPQESISHLPGVKADVWRPLDVKTKVFDESEYEVWPPKPKKKRAGEPELPEIHWADVLCVGPIMLGNLYRLFGSFSIFALLAKSHPVRLLLIRASVPALINAGALVHGGQMALWVALLAPLPYLFIDDPFIYWAGARYGDRMTGYLIEQDPSWEKRIAKGERAMERWGAWAILIGNLPFVPIPISIVYFLAGDSRMPVWLFVLADLVSLELLVGLCVWLGYALGPSRAQPVVDQITKFGLVIFVVSTVFIVGYTVVSVRRNLARMRERDRAAEESDDD